MRINHNIAALNTYRQLSTASSAQSKSMEKLSSGLRINKAGDDAAGLAISEKMRGQIRGLEMSSKNSQDGISLLQTAEGALNETHSILQRMRELTVQAHNGTNTGEDTSKIQEEINQLVSEIDGIGDRTQFNKQNLIDGTLGAKTANVGTGLADGTGKFKIADVTGAAVGADYKVTTAATGTDIKIESADGKLSQTVKVADITGVNVGDKFHFDKLGITLEAQATDVSSVDGTGAAGQFDVATSGIKFQIGANGDQTLAISINDMRADQLGSGTIKMDDIDVTDFATSSFDDQLAAIDDAISSVSSERSKLGAWQNRLEHTIANLDTSGENLTAAESRIRDVDMAKEMMNQTKNSILSQAAQAMLAQSNQMPQGVLQLLR
ncbi:flagellin [Rossellomorea sp. KS-H15a]|uniref:flagellin N-terminal helical domain-containing protein n=1 Tax=Rossellomorea sp. KS-H15a TaxID=2963940 RepID=UPI0020C6E009|nr:flagellin [Rossellomorea sp. KS-H15a]UTE77308.1 flagellin [Rossellomorea sp. KS-H15a]